MKGFVYRPDKLDSLRRDFPEWEKLDDGIHPMSGTDPDGKPFAYKVGVRKTPNAWFFIAYDMARSLRARCSSSARCTAPCWCLPSSRC